MIRPYQPRDLDALVAVWERASRITHPFLDEAFLRQERAQISTVYLPTAATWVYVKEGNVVGFISLVGHEVGGLFVDPPVQGEGIGRALMDHVRGLRTPLEVEVFEANRIGRRFYHRYGFEKVKELVHEQTGHRLLRLRLSAPGARARVSPP